MRIGLAIFVGTVEWSAGVSFDALLVDIDASLLGAAGGTSKFSSTCASVHYSILTINIIAR